MSADIETKHEIYTDLADLAKHEDVVDALSKGRRVYRVPTETKVYFHISSSKQTAMNAVARHLVATTVGMLDATVVNTIELYKALKIEASKE